MELNFGNREVETRKVDEVLSTSQGALRERCRACHLVLDRQGSCRTIQDMGTPLLTKAVLFGQQYCHPYETVLTMREKRGWSNHDMDIFDVNGVVHFKLVASLFSLRDKRVLYNATGTPVCSFLQRLMTLRGTTLICPGANPVDGNHLAKFQKVILSMLPQGQLFYRGNKSSVPDIQVLGNFYDRQYQITSHSGVLLAEAHRDTARNYYTGFDSYTVRIMAGVDTALITAIIVIIEDVFIDDMGKGN
eukprot:jgi/Mesen1/10728/ME000090S10189